jgi:hypothetical protein
MKLNLFQILVATGISILFVVLVGGKMQSEEKFIFTFVSSATLIIYLSALIGIRFESKKIETNVRALSLIFIAINIVIILIFSKLEVFSVSKYLAIELIPALIFLSITSAILKIKKI